MDFVLPLQQHSGSGGSAASPRPNEEGVVLGVQWEKEGEAEEING